MSRPAFTSSHSTPAFPTSRQHQQQPAGWPIYDPYTTLKRRDTSPMVGDGPLLFR
ncbi:hypothetical protein M408DRAFT_325489 [Serendipita vermifera MAFF 305830]|uniref:Uncharacterized protein n=1 Tax=Serendipita vermifera MAFF 305830 TaxID=933852 RepID=A0A0C3BAT3_SERVB|nr:hypothetical protein M408DRAFT_325489 [Serendipita vermifera MAFF 305830]